MVAIYKGANSIKTVDGVMVLNLYKLLMMLYICTKLQENISKDFDVTCLLKYTKGHNSVKSVGVVMELVLYISSDNALYLHQVWQKYLKRFQKFRPRQKGRR